MKHLRPFNVASVFCMIVMIFPPPLMAQVKAGELISEVRATMPAWQFGEAVKKLAPLISDQFTQTTVAGHDVLQAGNVQILPNVKEPTRADFFRALRAGTKLADVSASLLFFDQPGGSVVATANTTVDLFSDRAEMDLTYLPASVDTVSELGSGRIDAELTVRFNSFIDQSEVREMTGIMSAEDIPKLGMLVDASISEGGGKPVKGVLMVDFSDLSTTAVALAGHDQSQFERLMGKIMTTGVSSELVTMAVSPALFLLGFLIAVIVVAVVCVIGWWIFSWNCTT